MLSPQPRPDNLLFAERERSPVQRDSFFVLPASFDRTITVRIDIENAQGIDDSRSFDLFIPRIATSAAEDLPSPLAFRVHGLYPNPALPGQPVNIDLESRGTLRLVVYDALGRECWQEVRTDIASGRRTHALRLPPLREGWYSLHLFGQGEMRTRRFLVLR